MSTAEIKLDLFRKLDTLDSRKIKEVYGLIVNYLNKKGVPDFWDELSEEEKNAINDGIDQLDKGQSLSYSDVRANIRKKHNI
ncbi:MAG: hypothetical protein A2275_04205 [Bacteroidetes bacterium RIFOXYA12_FULL_35_11]|nr:MAG: hypothetical protein A2X01_10345 [Bacteroidetes bacterium GWF2_35_48]OFY81020.1 MAG: hypothetical protein A2275_04205 [Bacteroidetes bacterium RIFOXYA12_FULL_35_11]HBX49952.1 hypothetical protein [Bacteroidales bacterium]